MQWNVRSFQKNKPFIQSAVDDYKPDAICLQETWAKPAIDMKLNSYTTAASRDRENIIGGGVSVHIKTDIPNTKIELKTNLEAAATKVYLPSYAITLCSLYLSNNVNNPDLINEPNKLREQLPVPFLILTDINGHHSSWGSDYCDARGKIIGLTSPNKNSHYLIFKIAEIMSRNPQKFTIEWIPSHQNINGNEKADTLAKQACSNKTSAWIKPSTKEIKDKISNYYKNKRQVRWRKTNAALYKYSPTIKLHSSLSLKCQEQIALTILRMNMCIETHGHYFKGNPAPTCESCNTRVTINHLLIDCPLYNKQREPVTEECNIKCVPFTMQSILSDDFAADIIVNFLKTTELINKL